MPKAYDSQKKQDINSVSLKPMNKRERYVPFDDNSFKAKDLYEYMADKYLLTKAEAERHVRMVFESVMHFMVVGDRVSVAPFGRFIRDYRPAGEEVYSPRAGEMVARKKDRFVVKFSITPKTKNRLLPLVKERYEREGLGRKEEDEQEGTPEE